VRARRTRAAIVTAHVDLLAEGELRPTADRIAERAGVSVRALWLHFADMEALYEAVAAEVLARQDRRFRPVDPDLDLATRIDLFCRQRAAQLSAVAPFARASQLREPFSSVLRDYHRRHVERVSREIATLFAGELGRAGAGAGEGPVAALTAATTWGAWSVLRDDLGLSRRRAQDVLARTVRALLADLLDEDERPAGHRAPPGSSRTADLDPPTPPRTHPQEETP
jgi:AcrR family transcriptional regulator